MEHGKTTHLPQASDVDRRSHQEEYSNVQVRQFESFLSRISVEDDNLNTRQVIMERWDSDGEEDFCDPDYNISDEDDDFQEVIAKENTRRGKGRPRNVASKSDLSSRALIVVPQQTADVDSDYADSDELLEEFDSEKENDEVQEEVSYEEYNKTKHRDKPMLALGMKFGGFEEFKQACRDWGIKHRRQLHFPTSDTVRVICTCKENGCPFRVHASKLSQDDPTVQIKSINLTHIGGNVFDNFHMTPEYIAKRYLENFRADPDWSVKGLIAAVLKDCSYTISYKKAWRAKQKALEWVHGEEGLQYSQLLSYRAELLNSNPGSSVVIWRDGGKFQGFYVCLGALKESFKSGCRPIISLDGCWLKGTFGGNLLSAVAIDPNDCIFPIAYAVIAQNESRETWSWFLENLGHDLEIRNSHHIAFMSDRQKGLIGAVKDLFPSSEHRNCVRHIYQNFRGKHKGKALKDLVWKAAMASNEVIFKKCMKDIEEEDKEAREWFNHSERPLESWTRALFSINTRCDMLLNNLCESFNRYILDARDKPIITMLEMIKNKLMNRLYKKRIWIDKYQGMICPKIVKKLNKINAEAAMFRPEYSGGPKVRVIGPGGPYVVDMMAKSCTCRRFDLTGLPCTHAYVSIIGNHEKIEKYVNAFYHVDTFKSVYSQYINPTNHEDLWPKVVDCVEILPPKIVKKKKGRKPKNRKENVEELETKKAAVAAKNAEKRAEKKAENTGTQKLSRKSFVKGRCSICKNSGHNARGHYKWAKRSAEASFSQPEQGTNPTEQGQNDDFWGNSQVWINSYVDLNLTQEGAQTMKSLATEVPDEALHVAKEFLEVLNGLGGLGADCETSVQVTELPARPSSMSKSDGHLKRKVIPNYMVTNQKKSKI